MLNCDNNCANFKISLKQFRKLFTMHVIILVFFKKRERLKKEATRHTIKQIGLSHCIQKEVISINKKKLFPATKLQLHGILLSYCLPASTVIGELPTDNIFSVWVEEHLPKSI